MLTAEHHPDCYPSDPTEALPYFRKALALANKQGQEFTSSKGLPGIVTPHIDFRVSLAAYATAFAPLLQVPLAETYVILGVGHSSYLEWNLDRSDYQTPLGRAVCARDLVDRLAQGGQEARLFSPEAHVGEHSIEFPLVWLQALHRLHPAADGATQPVRFVPVLCGGMHGYVNGRVEWDDLEDLHRLSAALADVMDQAGEKVRVIVSIDGCHLGPRFRHPFRVTPALLKATEGWEQMLWNVVAEGDTRQFLDWVREEGNDRYFDGVGALALLLATGERLRAGVRFAVQRTYYEQWFTEQDASAVTFSSGLITKAKS